jgi:ATP adenylyltransferase
MVLPLRAVPELEDLTPEEHTEIWGSVTRAVVALKSAFGCDGVNVGLNLGAAAGGSQSDHLHVHCVPRWVGDANFISVAAETRVLPLSLAHAWERLTAAWEAAGP